MDLTGLLLGGYDRNPMPFPGEISGPSLKMDVIRPSEITEVHGPGFQELRQRVLGDSGRSSGREPPQRIPFEKSPSGGTAGESDNVVRSFRSGAAADVFGE